MTRSYMKYNETADCVYGEIYTDILKAVRDGKQDDGRNVSDISVVEVEVKIINPGTRIVGAT